MLWELASIDHGCCRSRAHEHSVNRNRGETWIKQMELLKHFSSDLLVSLPRARESCVRAKIQPWRGIFGMADQRPCAWHFDHPDLLSWFDRSKTILKPSGTWLYNTIFFRSKRLSCLAVSKGGSAVSTGEIKCLCMLSIVSDLGQWIKSYPQLGQWRFYLTTLHRETELTRQWIKEWSPVRRLPSLRLNVRSVRFNTVSSTVSGVEYVILLAET